MNKFFRWGIGVALLILIGSAVMAARIIFVEEKDVIVPSLVGMSAVEAANKLQSTGLSARIDQVDSEEPENTVVSQNISAGERAAKGNIVTIRASRGGAMIQVPDVRGLEFAEAVKKLDASGLKMGNVLRVPDQLKPVGTVIAQNPASPASVLSTRMIELLVSEGGQSGSSTVQVPDLVGQEESMARQIVEQSGLVVSRALYIDSKLVPAGSVTRTQPRAGARVQNGAAVVLYVAKAQSSAAPDSGTQTTPRDSGAQSQSTQSGTIQTQPVIPTHPNTSAQTPPTDTAAAPPTVPVIPETSAQTPAISARPAQPQHQPVPGKTARIRYQVPPLSRSLSLKIQITDSSGTRILRSGQTGGGEYITIDAPYANNADVTVYLDGELVWEERYE
ncbi:penicillin-binding protein [Synergistales bacterium]|nr:penicillin-binding protein [Synergistales bacterium]